MANKRGSSRRKGDEYQDLTALKFALERYINRVSFSMYLEYEKAGNLDDIVIFQEQEIHAYQIKYSINPLGVFNENDLTGPDSPVSIRKFSDSWKIIKDKHPEYHLTAYLCSNRSLNTTLVDLITPEGRFTPRTIEDRRRGEAKEIRSNLFSATGLNPESFSKFLADFKFHIRQPTLEELEQDIRVFLLDKALGLSDGAIFLDLKEAIKNNALFSHEAITSESIDNLLQKFQSKLLTPQVFPVNKEQFVEQKSLSTQLNNLLPTIDGNYLIVTGLPGSGKSTSLTTYFKTLDESECEVFSYYCFVGVNDNAQKMRAQAESLRANLLKEFHDRYPHVLNHRFDYSERNFNESLKALAEYFINRGRRFVIYLDGLDHVERLESEIRDNIISALPVSVPSGITIVVATQELHQWPHFLKCTRESSETHIQMPLFSLSETRDYLISKRGITGLSNADIQALHSKSEGLPLYLQYAAEVVLSNDTILEAMSSLSPATGGDIRKYYEIIWAEFELSQKAEAKHLCAVMSCLRFPIHRKQLYPVQKSLTRPQFESAYKSMSHLLRNFEDKLTIFHNSFRDFMSEQLEDDWLEEIKSNIASFLKSEKNTALWFEYVFEYCHEIGDYQYIINEVNADFVENSLISFRPSEDIYNAITWAIESAYKSKDIVQISRLASLQHKTDERLEHNIDRTLLSEALLALGRERDLVTFAFSQEANRWIVDQQTSLTVMSTLADTGKIEFGRKLFDVFTEEFRGIKAHNNEKKPQIIALAQCLGIYARKQARPLRWIASYPLRSESNEVNGLYAPHLEAYIDSLVKFKREAEWKRLKRVKRLFPNDLIKHLLIRSLAKHDCIDDLREILTEYVKQKQTDHNLELAFYAAKSGMPSDKVSAIAGLFEAPENHPPEHLYHGDEILQCYAYSFIILGYAEDQSTYDYLLESAGAHHTLWASALQHLLISCYCIGQSYQSETYNLFAEACESIDALVDARQGSGERIFESINLIRNVLPFTIGQLTREIQRKHPEKLNDWAKKIAQLRESILWTTHFGISESIQDYQFELDFWAEISKCSLMRTKITFILKDCATTYEKSTLLKGNSRYIHFMRLATLMANCGMKGDAEKWLKYGLRSSLSYGYHKDVTLQVLIDMLNLLNKYQPEKTLERCSRILEMDHWMAHQTSGRETEGFTKNIFSIVLSTNRQAAFDLLVQFSQSVSRWKMQECLEKYLLKTEGGDYEYLWCLSEIFSNHSNGSNHCKQLTGTRQHIVNIQSESSVEGIKKAFMDQFRDFVLAEINPRHWPDKFKKEPPLSKVNNEEVRSVSGSSHEFLLDGVKITRECLAQKRESSFSGFLQLLKRLKEQNDHFFEPDFVRRNVKYHIENDTDVDELTLIKDHLESEGRIQNPDSIESLAARFQDMGEYENAAACFGIAFSCKNTSLHWRKKSKYIEAIAEYDTETAKETLLNECYNSVSGSKHDGYDIPPISATGLDALSEIDQLEVVFNDFVEHCESMFAQLPATTGYSWLKEYTKPSFDENTMIFQLALDELTTSEIDHGNRLVRALTKLVLSRPDNTIHILVDKILSSSGRVFRRLLMILLALSDHKPALLVEHQQKISQLLQREDFTCRQTVLKTLAAISAFSNLNSNVAREVAKIERKYSANHYASTYRLPIGPDPIFSDFLERNTLFCFLEQISILEKILQTGQGSLIAATEERLKTQNWDMDEEGARVKDNWDGNSHPQGWPVVWITTDFQELVTEALSNILNEAVEKLRLSDQYINWLWQVIQTVDTEYLVQDIKPRPDDIPRLLVTDKNEWLRELNYIEPLQFLNNSDDWVTVFEKTKVSQDETFNVPYRREVSLSAMLVPQKVYGGTHNLQNYAFPLERLNPLTGELSMTVKQTQDEVRNRRYEYPDMNADCLPLIAIHKNPEDFLGYLHICSLASYLIDSFNLTFDGLNLTRGGEIVARYDIWREGHEDDAYTREKLSEGTRLRVSRSFLTEVCNKYNKMLCIRINEKREFYEYSNTVEPSERNNFQRFRIYHSF